MHLLKYLELNRTYTYSGTLQELKGNLSANSDFNIDLISDGFYKVSSKESWGTLIVNNSPGLVDGINVLMSINNTELNKQTVIFSSKVRIEHFLMAIVFVLFSIGAVIQKEPFLLLLALMGVWMISHLWFQLIYRSQENFVVESMVNSLGLRETTD